MLQLVNGFSYRSYGFPACMCVTLRTDTPTYGNGVPKSEISKKNISRKGIVLKQKRDGIENTAPPQPNCCCKIIYIVKKTITTYTL